MNSKKKKPVLKEELFCKMLKKQNCVKDKKKKKSYVVKKVVQQDVWEKKICIKKVKPEKSHYMSLEKKNSYIKGKTV